MVPLERTDYDTSYPAARVGPAQECWYKATIGIDNANNYKSEIGREKEGQREDEGMSPSSKGRTAGVKSGGKGEVELIER